MGLGKGVGGVGQFENRGEEILQGVGVNRQELRGPGKFPQQGLNIAGPDGTDITERLGDDEVRSEGLQPGEIEGQRRAASHRLLADRLVDLLAGESGVKQRAGDAGERFDTDFGPAVVSHTCANDGVVEGVKLVDGRAFSVQYHPEAAAGPHDANYLFDQFVEMMERTATS